MDTNSNIRRGMRSTRVPLLRADAPTISDEQHKRNVYAECVAEVAAEENAAEHKRLAPVRELEKKLAKNLEAAKRDARADLITWDDFPYLQEICPPFTQPQGDLCEAIQNAFRAFQEVMTEKG